MNKVAANLYPVVSGTDPAFPMKVLELQMPSHYCLNNSVLFLPLSRTQPGDLFAAMDKSWFFFAMLKHYWDLFTCTSMSMENYHQNLPKALSARHSAKLGTSMASVLGIPPRSTLLKTSTICLLLEKGLLSPTSTNRVLCTNTALVTAKKK